MSQEQKTTEAKENSKMHPSLRRRPQIQEAVVPQGNACHKKAKPNQEQRQSLQNGSSSGSSETEYESGSPSYSIPDQASSVCGPSQNPQPHRQSFTPFAVKDLFLIILEHLLKNISVSTRSSRLNYLLIQLRENVPLKEVMNRFDMKDLTVVAEHKKFLEILNKDMFALLQREEYASFKDIDYKKMILEAYSKLNLDLNLKLLRSALMKAPELGKISTLIEELLILVKSDTESNNMKFITQEDELMSNRILGKSTQVIPQYDPFTDFTLSKDNQYDQISKYGIFCNKKQECELSKDGIFNYRLHRTMILIQRFAILVPQENIKVAKNLATFLIKLTDTHIDEILRKSIRIASVATRPSSSQISLDQVSYFSPTTLRGRQVPKVYPNLPQPNLQQADEYKINKLKYPAQMKLYRNLRAMEFIQQESLFNNIGPELVAYLSHGKRRLNREEKTVLEYYTAKPNTIEYISKLNADIERQPVPRQKNVANRIPIRSKHIRNFLECHSHYRNHQILWRFNAVY